MFEQLADKISFALQRLSGKGKLNPTLIKEATGAIKKALLESDVSYKVVKEFLKKVESEAVGVEVLSSITPAQKVVKIVYDNMVELLGGKEANLSLPQGFPVVLMLVGLQGSGKTTMCGKLANFYKQKGYRPLLVAMDTHRPAAGEQLRIVAEKAGVQSVIFEPGESPIQVGERALKEAGKLGLNLIIFDTAGRHQLSEDMMVEAKDISERFNPHRTLLVLDAMTGQQAVEVALEFSRWIGIDGFIITKLDGDARGGAALSVRALVGKPIYFAGVGEKLEDLEPFYPDRIAKRILGMGDIVTLVEKAERAYSEETMEKLEKKFKKAKLDFNDLLEQFEALEKMGSLDNLVGMLPGVNLRGIQVDEKALKKIKSIIYSMTPYERANPHILDGSRKLRIARGSGTKIEDVNRLVKQLEMMRNIAKQMGKQKFFGGFIKGF